MTGAAADGAALEDVAAADAADAAAQVAAVKAAGRDAARVTAVGPMTAMMKTSCACIAARQW